MGYPIDLEVFEEYFVELRNLRSLEHLSFKLLCGNDLSHEARQIASDRCNDTRKRIRVLKEEHSLPSRTFDIYQGELDLALEKFMAEFPIPEKPEPCRHASTELRLKTHADDSTHIVTQCLDCGAPITTHKKDGVPFAEKLPLFDKDIKCEKSMEYWQWVANRNEIIDTTLGEEGRYPEFDLHEFRVQFEKRNTKPFCPGECNHTSQHVTVRRYSTSNVAAVLQCKDCGLHIKSVPKREFGNLDDLPEFDAFKEPRLNKAVRDWYNRRALEEKKAREEFNKDLVRKIRSGEVSRVDKSKFGTYYTSEEWLRTRERILDRDDYTCQACGEGAECVHHLTYDRLGCENNFDLISLCHQCHYEVHLYQDKKWFGYRLTPKEIFYLEFK